MMNRTFNLKVSSSQSHREISRNIAFHEAGHAAAIHLGNQQKGLPPVFFQICVKPLNTDFQSSECLGDRSARYMAKVEGGRLIHTIATSFHETTKYFSNAQKLAYQCAFEADIINLLVGPLAEARYIALCDNELINPRLVNIEALQYYGGSSDLELVNEYLDCFIVTRELERKNSRRSSWTHSVLSMIGQIGSQSLRWPTLFYRPIEMSFNLKKLDQYLTRARY